MPKRNIFLTLIGLLTFLFIGFGSVQSVYAAPSITVSPISGPIYTMIKATLSGLTPLSYVFIRFDGADFPEWQQKADEKGSAVFSSQLYRFPASITKGSQTILMKDGIHIIEAYAQGSGGRFLASTTFTVVDSSNPPKLTITPSSGPVGTKVEIRAVNVPPLTSPRLALKDGIEQVSVYDIQKQPDGSWAGTYVIPKDVVKYYDTSGKPIVIPIATGEHSVMLYEKTEIMSAPFTVTEIKTIPAPTPTPGDPIVVPTPAPIPAPTPTPAQDANICNPDIPSYSQPGCKQKETPVTPAPAPLVSKTCDPNIPRYAQEGCSASTVSEKPSEKPVEQKPTCNPDIPSYSQIGCILGKTQQTNSVSDTVNKEKLPTDTQLENIKKKTQLIQDNRYDDILTELKELRNKVKEQEAELKYLKGLTKGLEALKVEIKDALTKFITYGVDTNSQKLGAGERAAVLHSYKEAYEKLPESDEEMSDMIKIVNGRFPSERNNDAEKKAVRYFKQVYKRVPNLMSNQNDAAALMVMAYGLRQSAENRNLASEKKGIQTFMSLFGKTPQTTDEWNIMQAITYSGAQRRPDQDKDLLSDEDEKLLGTDPANSDTDKDGIIDGLEIENGTNPLDKTTGSTFDSPDWILPVMKKTGSDSTIEPSGVRGRRYIEDAG